MVVEQRTAATADTATAAPRLPRQYVVKQEVQAARKRRPLPPGRVALLVSTGLAAALLTVAASGVDSGHHAPAVVAADASATFPISYEGWRLDGLFTELESGTGDFQGTASITWTGANAVMAPQDFTVTVFRGGRKVGSLVGSIAKAIPGRAQIVEFGSTNGYAAGAATYTFRTGR